MVDEAQRSPTTKAWCTVDWGGQDSIDLSANLRIARGLLREVRQRLQSIQRLGLGTVVGLGLRHEPTLSGIGANFVIVGDTVDSAAESP